MPVRIIRGGNATAMPGYGPPAANAGRGVAGRGSPPAKLQDEERKGNRLIRPSRQNVRFVPIPTKVASPKSPEPGSMNWMSAVSRNHGVTAKL